jgi:nicotinate-nucleotide--dimethylbenzimidazole phosphoribosyltransferase
VAVDVGVAGDVGGLPNLVDRKRRRGTANMAHGPAMTFDEARGAVEAGIALVQEEIDRGADLVGTGEIGVGGHAAASAVLSAFTGRPVAEIVGLEGGGGAGTAEREVRAVQRALDLHQPDPANPLTILAQVGGLEMGLLTGVILGAAARRRPVALDGFVSGAAALIAAGLSSRAGEYLFASHRSAEPGHSLLLSHLSLAPLLDLGLGLGEGAGAALGLGVMEAAALCQKEMATFSQAGLSGPAE